MLVHLMIYVRAAGLLPITTRSIELSKPRDCLLKSLRSAATPRWHVWRHECQISERFDNFKQYLAARIYGAEISYRLVKNSPGW